MDEAGRSFLGVCVPAALALQPGPQWGSLGAQPPVLLPAPGGACRGPRLEAGGNFSRRWVRVHSHRSSQCPGVSAVGAPTNPPDAKPAPPAIVRGALWGGHRPPCCREKTGLAM